MRILLPYTDSQGRDINDPIVSGGGEIFCRLIQNDIGTLNEYRVGVENIPYDMKSMSLRDKEQYQNKIMISAEEVSGGIADVIICNFPEAIFTGQIIKNSSIPIMVIVHNRYGMTSLIKRWKELVEYGHSIFMVSQHQYEFYHTKAVKQNIQLPPISGFLNPSYCEENKKINDIEYECGTIGRCDQKKNPFLLRKLLKDSGVSNLVITGKPSLPTSNKVILSSSYLKGSMKYYEKNKNETNTLWDLPHKEVIENISKCKTYFSTCTDETWGISALEALSCGNPVILNGDKDSRHASTIIPTNKEHYKLIPNNDKDALVSAIKSFDKVDRKEIQEMTMEKHSKHNWEVAMCNAIDKTVENFKKKRITLPI